MFMFRIQDIISLFDYLYVKQNEKGHIILLGFVLNKDIDVD